ncbi:hypothetical protein HQ586_08225 [Candidatus Bathyarchaeota archaeon]|nr:hypothetical protein [Candidatus Bathyarchaeota archaeon]
MHIRKSALSRLTDQKADDAPVTEAWVEEIGADACGLDAGSAVKKSLKLMEA